MMRKRTMIDAAAATLDDVMRGLWLEFGETDIGVPEDACALFSRLAQLDLTEFFARFIYGTEHPDWEALFAPFGIHYRLRATASANDRGGRDEPHIQTNLRTLGLFIAEGGQALPAIKQVINGSAAWQAEISAGDTLVAIDGLRANGATLGKHLARFKAGEMLAVSYFRHDVLRTAQLKIPTPKLDTVWLSMAAESPDAQYYELRQQWL